MLICFIGDQHKDFTNLKKLIKHTEYKYSPDLYIQVGDFGLLYDYSDFLNLTNEIFKKINKKLIFIDGNHDDHHYLQSLKEEFTDIRSNIQYAKRGAILSINNKNILFVGGAFSIDRGLRELNYDYFEEEVLSLNEYEEILNKLKDKKIEIMVSHDTPSFFSHLNRNGVYKTMEDWEISTKHRNYLQNIFIASGAKINIHGHYHKRFEYDLLYDGKEYKEVSLDANIGPLNKQAYVLEI